MCKNNRKQMNKTTRAEGQGTDHDSWFTWLELNFGRWGAALAKIGNSTSMSDDRRNCCCIPIFRPLITSKISL